MSALLRMLKYIPWTQEMCSEAMCNNPAEFFLIPDHFKTQKMCIKAVEKYPYNLGFVPDHFKTREMCIKPVEDEPETLELVPDHLKAQGMCERTVEKYPLILIFVPDWFVTQGQVKLWHDHCNDHEIIKWYDCYQKRKAKKAKIKDELMPIAWHPLRWWDWCMPEDEKKEIEKFWV